MIGWNFDSHLTSRFSWIGQLICLAINHLQTPKRVVVRVILDVESLVLSLFLWGITFNVLILTGCACVFLCSTQPNKCIRYNCFYCQVGEEIAKARYAKTMCPHYQVTISYMWTCGIALTEWPSLHIFCFWHVLCYCYILSNTVIIYTLIIWKSLNISKNVHHRNIRLYLTILTNDKSYNDIKQHARSVCHALWYENHSIHV